MVMIAYQKKKIQSEPRMSQNNKVVGRGVISRGFKDDDGNHQICPESTKKSRITSNTRLWYVG